MGATRNTTKPTASTEAVKQITYLAAALKAPRITEAAARSADQARDAGWSTNTPPQPLKGRLLVRIIEACS